jgi:hypothetical protein
MVENMESVLRLQHLALEKFGCFSVYLTVFFYYISSIA